MNKKHRIDLTSATNGQVALVDNNSDHNPTPTGTPYRVTTEAHIRESCGTLTKKVDQVIPSPFDLKGGLSQGDAIMFEAETMSGTTEITVVRNGNSLSVTVVGYFGSAATIDVPIPRSLFTPNAYGEYADLLRATLMIVIRYANLGFHPASVEEHGFKKLRKFLWP